LAWSKKGKKRARGRSKTRTRGRKSKGRSLGAEEAQKKIGKKADLRFSEEKMFSGGKETGGKPRTAHQRLGGGVGGQVGREWATSKVHTGRGAGKVGKT